MKTTEVERHPISLDFFTVYEKPETELIIKLYFRENRTDNEAVCPTLIHCPTGEGIANVQTINFILSTCFGKFTSIASPVSQDGLTTEATVTLQVLNLQQENYYQVAITYTNGKVEVIGKGKFLYL